MPSGDRNCGRIDRITYGTATGVALRGPATALMIALMTSVAPGGTVDQSALALAGSLRCQMEAAWSETKPAREMVWRAAINLPLGHQIAPNKAPFDQRAAARQPSVFPWRASIEVGALFLSIVALFLSRRQHKMVVALLTTVATATTNLPLPVIAPEAPTTAPEPPASAGLPAPEAPPTPPPASTKPI